MQSALSREGQDPGVDEAIRADLVNTDLLFRVLAMLFPGLEPGPLVAELRERLTEELDYTVEASNQRFFAADASSPASWFISVLR